MMHYDHLMALTTTTVNGEILAPVTNVPAAGSVTFKILMELRDTVDNVVYTPKTFVATLDSFGQFSIVLPYNDSTDITPTGWQYWVYVDTDVWTELFYITLPTSAGNPVDFADLMPLSPGDGSDCTPDGTACAPISVLGEIAALSAAVDDLTEQVDDLTVLVNSFAGDISDLQDDVADIQADIVTINGQLAVIVADIADINSDLSTLQTAVTTLQGQVGTLQAQMTTVQGQIATLQGQVTTLQGQVATNTANIATNTANIATNTANIATNTANITTLQGQVAANTAAIALKVAKAGDTMTGDLIISNAYLRQNRTVGAGLAIPSPLFQIDFTTVPLITDPNIWQVSVNGSSANLSGWLNEVGHYRAEQRTNYLFDHLVTLIASFAAGTGRLIRFERRDGANVRQITGGIDQDGRLETSLYPFTTITNIDPGATGKYSAVVAGGIATISVRREFNDICRLQGRIAVTAAGTVSGDVIMVLPAGFIPTKARWMSVTNSGGIAIPCEIINATGQVIARRTQAGAANLAFDDFTYVTS